MLQNLNWKYEQKCIRGLDCLDQLPAEIPIHEAVSDRIATWRAISQQMEEGHAATAQRGEVAGRERGHHVDHIQRCPTDEELYHLEYERPSDRTHSSRIDKSQSIH